MARRIPARFGLDPIRDVQVLCPMSRGGFGARSLNLELQRLLNPAGEARVERFGWTFGPGDKVMQVVNDYENEVLNGDLGLVRTIDPAAGELLVDLDGREVGYDFGELDEGREAQATLRRESAEREKRCPDRSHRPPGAAASAGPTNPWGWAHPARWLAGGWK